MTTIHLTDDQFAECVIMAPSPESEAHLLECSRCRQELSGFAASMNDFSMSTLAWSEAQPAVSLRAAAQKRPSMQAPLRWALACAMVIAVGIPVVLHGNRSPIESHNVASSIAPDDSDDQIAQDNNLMRSVNLALNAHEPSPLAEYGLQTDQRMKSKAAPEMRTQ